MYNSIKRKHLQYILPVSLLLSFNINAKTVTSPIPKHKIISLRADLFCPYNCDPKAKLKGYMVDIADEILTKAGYRLDYQLTNWPRAIQAAKNGKTHGIIGAFKGDAPNFILHKSPMGISKNKLWVHKDSIFHYNKIDSFNSLTLGLIKNYSYGSEVDNYVKAKNDNVKQITGSNTLARNILLIERHRIDATIEDEAVMDYQINNSPKRPKIKPIAIISEEAIYIAFSPALPESKRLSLLIDTGIKELRKSGRLAKILSPYGLTDWEIKDQKHIILASN